ncbi:MAG TPA: hypothetical protein VIZ90_11080 [Rhizobiaceae bacterium]
MTRFNSRLAVVCLIAAVTLTLFALMRVPLTRLDVAFTFVGDAVDKLTQIKTVAESGWLFRNDRLGFPFGYDRLDFPRFDSPNYAIMGPIAAITGEAGTAMNLYFIAGFYLIALTAFFSFRHLGFSIAVALICALLYAFLPYHIWRGVFHITNGAYYLVPLAMLVLVRLAQGRIGADDAASRKRWIWALVVAALLPLQMPYNGVFFAFLCVVACAISLASSWRWRQGLVAVSLIAATVVSFSVEQIPVWINAAQKGSIELPRLVVEAELYGMRLNQVLLPTEQHRLAKFRDITGHFNADMHVPKVESRNQYVGILGVVGFLALLWALMKSVRRQREESREIESVVAITAILSIAAFLLATTSGVGTLIAFFVTDNIRAFNRILPFLAFGALVGGAWVLQWLFSYIRGTIVRAAVAVLVGIFLLLDTVILTEPAAVRAQQIASYDQAKAYFTEVEGVLGNGAAVFQMPFLFYPEHPPVERMFNYDDFVPYLLTKTLRFSAGAGRQREGYKWGHAVEGLQPPAIITEVRAKGFDAILIDGYAYKPEQLQSLVQGFSAELPTPPVVSPDQRWWTFSLKD